MRRFVPLTALASACLFVQPAQAQRTELKMPLVTQQTPVWCWAATASMALNLLGYPDINPAHNYQCGVVAAAFPDCADDCTKCVTRLGPIANLVGVLDRYKALAVKQQNGPAGASISPDYVAYPQWDRITRSLKLSYPVIGGISPDGAPDNAADSEHTVLITGFDDNFHGTGEKWVVLRDPYPYAAGKSPYAAAGYSYDVATGTAQLPWRVLLHRMNLTSAIFLEKRSA